VTDEEQKHVLQGWLNQHKTLIFKIVRAYARVPMDREDLFQEITIQVWRSIPAFRNESSITTWIYRIALNTSIKWVKKERQNHAMDSLEEVQHILLDSGIEPDERLMWLYEEIYKLNEIDRSIALLLLDSFSYKEMAAILGITESNVGVKINRIKKLLITKSKQYDHHGI
jgi:RNA polymerase sigma-70 factor (ECF subfamily)